MASKRNRASRATKATSKGSKGLAASVSVGELGALPVGRGQHVRRYRVVGPAGSAGKLARFAVLAWTPDYDHERQTFVEPKLYVFASEQARDDFQTRLYDNQPNLLLQAYGFRKPLRVPN